MDIKFYIYTFSTNGGSRLVGLMMITIISVEGVKRAVNSS